MQYRKYVGPMLHSIPLRVTVTYKDEDIEKSSTDLDREDVRKARSKAKNTMEFVCRILSERSLWKKCTIMVDMGNNKSITRDKIGTQHKYR